MSIAQAIEESPRIAVRKNTLAPTADEFLWYRSIVAKNTKRGYQVFTEDLEQLFLEELGPAGGSYHAAVLEVIKNCYEKRARNGGRIRLELENRTQSLFALVTRENDPIPVNLDARTSLQIALDRGFDPGNPKDESWAYKGRVVYHGPDEAPGVRSLGDMVVMGTADLVAYLDGKMLLGFNKII